jgi:hypothetical protein
MTVRAVMPIALPSAKENQMTKPAALLTSLIASSLAFAANPVRILNTWTWPEPVTVLTTDQPVRLTLRPMSGSGAARTVDLGAPRERLAIDLPGRTILELETLRDQVSTRVEVELGARCVNADYRVIYQDAASAQAAAAKGRRSPVPARGPRIASGTLAPDPDDLQPSLSRRPPPDHLVAGLGTQERLRQR